jgi:hypothetical protein
MSILDRFRSPEAKEKQLAGLEMEHEIVNQQAEMAERKAIIKEFEKRYGPEWKKMFGLKGWVDLSTLRSLQKGNTGLGHFRRQSEGGLGHLKRGFGDLSHLRNTGPDLSDLRRM